MALPILLDIPESFETQRLLIRSPRPGDGAETNAAVLETFESLNTWMPWAKERPTVEQTEEYCRRGHCRYLAREDFVLRLIHKESGLVLGSSGLHPCDWSVPSFEIGYWCRKRFEGKGYITEAALAIVEFGFQTMKAQRIQIRCDVRNLRSIRVAERIGMKFEGEMRHDSVANDGTLRDSRMFGMTLADWQELKSRAV